MSRIRNQKGFTLFEMIAVLILVGIIGAFVGLFLFTGVSGFITSKNASETALKAQIALDRISAELRHIDSLPSNPVQDTQIEYKSRSRSLPGTRKISYNSVNGEILLTVNGSTNVLIDSIQTFYLRWTARDLDASGDSKNEIGEIKIEFATKEIGTLFSVEIYPRGLLPAPPS
jgi:prepilin-type N-terminal cleavage/methylation domain-containing protein